MYNYQEQYVVFKSQLPYQDIISHTVVDEISFHSHIKWYL